MTDFVEIPLAKAQAYGALLRLILDDMPAATNSDLAADGPVGDSERGVWAQIEATAQSIRDFDGPKCVGCGKPEGKGTLLDFSPEPPPAARGVGAAQETWERFARRYKCPVCQGVNDLPLNQPAGDAGEHGEQQR